MLRVICLFVMIKVQLNHYIMLCLESIRMDCYKVRQSHVIKRMVIFMLYTYSYRHTLGLNQKISVSCNESENFRLGRHTYFF